MAGAVAVKHEEVAERLSACFSAGFNHAGSAVDHGFRVLLLTGSWLLYAGGRVLCFIAQRLATGEASLAAMLASDATAAAERKRIADVVRDRAAGEASWKRNVPLQFLPKGTIEKWYVPEDKGWN